MNLDKIFNLAVSVGALLAAPCCIGWARQATLILTDAVTA